jgi:hypothetical protein
MAKQARKTQHSPSPFGLFANAGKEINNAGRGVVRIVDRAAAAQHVSPRDIVVFDKSGAPARPLARRSQPVQRQVHPRVQGAMLAPGFSQADYMPGRGPAAAITGFIKPPTQWLDKGPLDPAIRDALKIKQMREESAAAIRRSQYTSPFAYLGRTVSNAAVWGGHAIEGLPAAAIHGATETVPHAMQLLGMVPGTTAQDQIDAGKKLAQQDVIPTVKYYGTLSKEFATDPLGTIEKRGAEVALAGLAAWNGAGMGLRMLGRAGAVGGDIAAGVAQTGKLAGGVRVARGRARVRAEQMVREVRPPDVSRPAGAPSSTPHDRQYRFISDKERRAAAAEAAQVTGNYVSGRAVSWLKDVADWSSKSSIPGSARYREDRIVSAPTHDRSGRPIGHVDENGNPTNNAPDLNVPRRPYSPNPLTRIIQKRIGEPVGAALNHPLTRLRDAAGALPYIPSAAESAYRAAARNETYQIPENTDAAVASEGRAFAKLISGLKASGRKNNLPESEAAQGMAAAALRAMGVAENLGGSRVWGRDVFLARAKNALENSKSMKRSERKALEQQVRTLEAIPDHWLDPATAPKHINDLHAEAVKILRTSTDIKKTLGVISAGTATWGGSRTQAQLLGAQPLAHVRAQAYEPVNRDLALARQLDEEIKFRESNGIKGNRVEKIAKRYENYSTDALRTHARALRIRARTMGRRASVRVRQAEQEALKPFTALTAAERAVADTRAELARLSARRTPDPQREHEIARLQQELDQKIADAKFESQRAAERARMAGQGSRALRRAAAGRAKRVERAARYELNHAGQDAQSALGSAFAAGRRYGRGEQRVALTNESPPRPARGQSVPMPATFGDIPNAEIVPGRPTHYSISIPGEKTQSATTHQAALDIAGNAGPGAEQVVIRRVQGGKYTVMAERVVRGKKGTRIETRPSNKVFDSLDEARGYVRDLQQRKVRYDFPGEQAAPGPRGPRRQGLTQMLGAKGRMYVVNSQQRRVSRIRREQLEPAIRESGRAQGRRAGTTPQARRAAIEAGVARGNTKGIPHGARGTHGRIERLKGMRQEERQRSVGTPTQIKAARQKLTEQIRAKNRIRERAYQTAYYGHDLPQRAGMTPGEYFPHRSITPNAALAMAPGGTEFNGAGAGMMPKAEKFNAGILASRGDIDLSYRPVIEALRSAVDARERTRVASSIIERFAVRDANGFALEGDAAIEFAKASGGLYQDVSGRKLAQLSSLSADSAEGQRLQRLLDQSAGAVSDKTYVIPTAVMKGWSDVLAPAGGAGKFIDQLNSLWKGGVLALSPRWYFQNFVGMWGQFILGAGADLQAISMAKNPLYADTLPGRISQNGLASYLGEYARQAGGQSSNIIGRLIRAGFSMNSGLEGVPRKAMFWASAKRSLSENHFMKRGVLDEGLLARAWLDVAEAPQKYGKIAARARKLALETDDPAKKARYLKEAENADLSVKGANQIIDDSIRVTERFMGDYSRFNWLEKNILKRVFPFYGWMRAIHRLAFALPVKHPKRAALLAAASTMAYDLYGLDRNDLTDPRSGIFTGDLMLGMSTMNPLQSDMPTVDLVNTVGQNLERVTGIPSLISELGNSVVDAFVTAAKQAGPLYERQYHFLSGQSVGGVPDQFSPGYQNKVQDYSGQWISVDPGGRMNYDPPTQSLPASAEQSFPLDNAVRQLLAGGRPYADASTFDLLGYAWNRFRGNDTPEQRAHLVQNQPKYPRTLEPTGWSPLLNILTGVPAYRVNPLGAKIQEASNYKRYLSGLTAAQRKYLVGVMQAKAGK